MKPFLPVRLALLIPLVFSSGCGLGINASSRAAPIPLAPGEHRAFLYAPTGGLLDGNLGGIVGADQTCQAAAVRAGLVGVYRAILSDDLQSARGRILFTGPVFVYSAPNARTQISDGTHFWSEDHQQSVNTTENYTVLTDMPVWTGTDETGGSLPLNCKNWTSRTPDPNDPFSQLGTGGHTGPVLQSRNRWSRSNAFEANPNVPCSWRTSGLYCVSQ